MYATIPLWILNGILFFTYLLSTVFLMVMQPQMPTKKRLQVTNTQRAIDTSLSKVNPTLVYENDLFGTFVKPKINEPKQKIKELLTAPRPPETQEPDPLIRQPAKFLPPLEIKLKGVLHNSNTMFTRAIIEEVKTKAEHILKVGDRIEDADLIKLEKNKAIFVRSNGQQEIIFISKEEAKQDPLFQGDAIWKEVIIPSETTPNVYEIETPTFIEQISNIAQLLDTLDITTAFSHGENMGLRVGKIYKQSLGNALGLQTGDVIVRINNIEPTTTRARLEIFNSIKNAGLNQEIVLQVLRNEENLILSFNCHTEKDENTEERNDLITLTQEKAIAKATPMQTAIPPQRTPPSSKRDANLAKDIIEQTTSSSDVPPDYRRHTRDAMLNFGGRKTFLQR